MTRLPTLALLITLALGACRDAPTEPQVPNGSWSLSSTWAGQVVITENTDAPQWPSDLVTIKWATVKGDSLELTVSYGGGCRTHSFVLLADAAWMESYPVQVGVRLAHDAENDNCKALLTRVLRFDLTPLKVAYDSSYSTTTGIIRLNIRGFNSVQYSW